LDMHHPQPRLAYNHRLEAQAQQLTSDGGVIPNSPNNNSVSSLGNYPPMGPGGFQDGKLLSPLAQDAYKQHQQQLSPNGPPRPPKVKDDTVEDPPTPSKREGGKHRERDENGEKIGEKIRKPKKKRTEEEKQRHKEKKEKRERERELGGSPASKKKSRDMLTPNAEEPMMSGRTPSSASRLNGPRPLSSNSNKENSRRRSHRSSQDTFGNGGVAYEGYGAHR